MSASRAGLYLHVPFCSRICPYCDFAVRTGDSARRKRYVDHLLGEISLNHDCALTFDTIYFGGGTPSKLEMQDLARVVDAIRSQLRLADRTWIFLEVNPEDVSPRSVEGWKGLGVDTISLGIQSLDSQGLEFLGREHSVDEGACAVSLAREADFETVSLDLIYGRPGQSTDGWRRELDRAVALGAQHITCYQLTIHDRTRFGLLARRGQLDPLPEESQAEFFRLTHQHLNAAGYQGYEVSQFASGTGHRSRHNLKYWDHTPYLGLGPSAHSFDGRRRWWNVRRTDAWQERIADGQRPIEEAETLDDRALALESLMLGFRTYAGVDGERLQSRWNVDLLAANADLLERLQTDGLLNVRGRRLRPTLEGLAVADSLAAMFEV